jgi:peptide/nickel transport system substrate-binding protein
MARRSATVGAVALAIATGTALAGCTTSSSPGTSTANSSGGSGSGAKVSIALASDPTTLDPHRGSVAADYLMERMMFDSLVRRDDGGKVIAGLASQWTATATSAKFTLRPDVTCSDGHKLTASDVAASLTRFADPKTGAAAATQVFGSGNTPTVAADDTAGTVSVTLAKPWSDLLMGLSLPQSSIICPTGLANADVLKGGLKGAGTGPYFLASAGDSKPGTSYNLTARSDYKWGPQYAKLPAGAEPSTVAMDVITSEATMANEMLAGQLDYIGLTGPDIARVAAKSEFHIAKSPIVRNFVVFNQRAGHPGADPAVRTAIAQALDATAFNTTVTKGSGTLLASIADASVPCANTDTSLLTPYNLSAAKAKLAGMKIKFEGTNAVAAGAGNDWTKAVLEAAGAQVDEKNIDSATWSSDVLANKGDWDMTIVPNLNLTNLMTTPASFFVGAEPPAGRNFGGVHNTDFTAAFGQAMATTDDTAKCAAWATAQKALLSAHDTVPLSAMNVYYVTSKRAVGIAPDGLFDPSTIRVP